MVSDPNAPHIQHGLGAVQRPMHACPLHAVFDEVTAGSLNDPACYRIPLPQILIITHALSVLLQIADDPRQRFLLDAAEAELLTEPTPSADDRLDLAFQHFRHPLTHRRHHLLALDAIEDFRSIP